MQDILYPLKKKLKIRKIASFDVETKNRDNDFYLVGLYYDNEYHAFYSPDDFYNHIKLYLKGYWIVATNLSFDLSSCFFNTKYWSEFDIIYSSGFMLSANSKNLRVKFIDTLNYHKASVKELGNILDSPKSEAPQWLGLREPKNPIEEAELRDYNKQDCVISYKFLDWFQSQTNQLGGELKITIASCGMDLFKRKFLKDILCKEEYVLKKRGQDVLVKDKIFKAYYGGRTECLKRGKETENLNYYDFNSLYPSVMINSLPMPNSVRYIEKGSYKEILSREGVSNVVVELLTDELPLLPYRKDGKLIFPKGKFEGWYTHLELRLAVKNGYIIHEVKETISYSMTFYPFTDYVTTMYKKRLEAKKKKSTEQLIFKLYMNTLYGKFAERIHNNTIFFDFNRMTSSEIDTFRSEKWDKEINIGDDRKGYYIDKEECTSSHVFPILPTYITAMGRIKLWKVARLNDVYYMDTDSIFTKNKLSTSNKLGDLKLELITEEAVFIRPKMYALKYYDENNILQTSVKMKGVPHADIEAFYKMLDNKPIVYNKFVKVKEGIRRNMKINSVYEVSKIMKKEDNKRDWIKEYNGELQKSKSRWLKCEVINLI